GDRCGRAPRRSRPAPRRADPLRRGGRDPLRVAPLRRAAARRDGLTARRHAPSRLRARGERREEKADQEVPLRSAFVLNGARTAYTRMGTDLANVSAVDLGK